VDQAARAAGPLRPDKGDRRRLGGEGTAPHAARRTRTVQDPLAAGDFYDTAIDAQLPEATRLANTIQTWWPAILVALTYDVSNARTEGFNRIIKQTKRVGCGNRNMINYQRRILSHIAVTRPQKSAA
jgi:hypothetical protein